MMEIDFKKVDELYRKSNEEKVDKVYDILQEYLNVTKEDLDTLYFDELEMLMHLKKRKVEKDYIVSIFKTYKSMHQMYEKIEKIDINKVASVINSGGRK